MKKSWLLSICTAASLTALSQSPMWGNLEKGPHFVGFRAISAYDYSRPSLVDQQLNGELAAAVPEAPGRQVQIGIWYPAAAAGKAMKYQDYVFELSRELDFSPLNETRKAAAREKLAKRYEADYGNSFKRSDLDKFLTIDLNASVEARPASGKFPVLLFPTWFSPADGSIMSEYLASQGFVVATTNLKGTDSTLPEISPRGLRSVASDLAFVLQQLGQLPYADVSKVALMGVGINASACATLLKDNSNVDAFISLDGGIITASELAMFQQTGFVSPASMTMPMLFMYAPHPSVNPVLADYFKYADKYYVNFRGMSEFYFLNNGMIEKFAPGMFGKPPGNVTQGFEVACSIVSAFLKFSLKGDASSKAAFTTDQPGEPQGPDKLEKSFKPALPAPPSLHELKILTAKEGAAGIRSAFDRLKAADPQPFTQLVLADFFSWLGFGRDNDFTRRTELTKIWLEMYPDASRGEYSMARLMTAQGKAAEARPHYQRALSLLASDRDIYLDNILRERIRLISEGELQKELK